MNDWETRVREIAQQFEYPPTPDIAGAVAARLATPRRGVTRRRAARIAAALLALLVLVALALPDLRAQALDWLGIGAVRILRENPPARTPTPGFDWADKVTLEEAQSRVNFALRLPPDLGPPNAVYCATDYEDIVVMVWDDLTLYQISPPTVVYKYLSARSEMATTINGAEARWIVQPHIYEFTGRDSTPAVREVDTNVLLWAEGGVTYRIETPLDLAGAARIAESLE